MPEQPEIQWLGWVFLAAVIWGAFILGMACRQLRKIKKEERRTHRRTRER